MKKSIYSLLILGFIISSCGTSNQYASSQYDDAIYNINPDKVITLNTTATDESLANLTQKTKAVEKMAVQGKDAGLVYLNDKGEANIMVVEGENTYLVLDSTMSYEERLRKFESPDYKINIYISDSWGWDYYNYFDPFRFRYLPRDYMPPFYRSGFYYDSWYSPFRSSYYSPFYGRFGYYYDPWSNYGYSGYYNPYSWYMIQHDYGYYGGYYPSGCYGLNQGNNNYHNWYSGENNNSGRSRYYGKRTSNFETVDKYDNPGSSSSIGRRNPTIEQIGGTKINPTQSREGSIYQRNSQTGSSGVRYNNEVVNTNRENKSTGQTERAVTNYRRDDGNNRGNVYSPTRTGNDRSNTSASRSESIYRKSSTPVNSYRGNTSGNSSERSAVTNSSRNTTSYERSSSVSTVRSSGNTSSGNTSSNTNSSNSSSTGRGYRR